MPKPFKIGKLPRKPTLKELQKKYGISDELMKEVKKFAQDLK